MEKSNSTKHIVISSWVGDDGVRRFRWHEVPDAPTPLDSPNARGYNLFMPDGEEIKNLTVINGALYLSDR